ncbi:MAG: hypothetical protein ACOYKZ_05285 [Chlamydiia bacterium]
MHPIYSNSSQPPTGIAATHDVEQQSASTASSRSVSLTDSAASTSTPRHRRRPPALDLSFLQDNARVQAGDQEIYHQRFNQTNLPAPLTPMQLPAGSRQARLHDLSLQIFTVTPFVGEAPVGERMRSCRVSAATSRFISTGQLSAEESRRALRELASDLNLFPDFVTPLDDFAMKPVASSSKGGPKRATSPLPPVQEEEARPVKRRKFVAERLLGGAAISYRIVYSPETPAN